MFLSMNTKTHEHVDLNFDRKITFCLMKKYSSRFFESNGKPQERLGLSLLHSSSFA